MRPTVEQILKRKIGGQSPSHIQWNTAKKKASSVVDVKIFKANLGASLDNLEQLYKGALEVKRFYPKLDDRTLKPVRERKTKVLRIVSDYRIICRDKAAEAGATPQQKKAWDVLSQQLGMVEANVNSVINPLLKG